MATPRDTRFALRLFILALRVRLTWLDKLDVYYPSGVLGRVLIILFTYGGGFQSGDRNLELYNGLVYANIGAFFAKQGCLAVIADYRLSRIGDPNAARYPDCSQDVNDALSFIVSSKEVNKVGDTHRIYLLAHSSGALMQSTLLFHPTILSNDLRSRIKGAIWNGGMYDLKLDPAPIPFNEYYDVEGKKDTSYTLLQKAPESLVVNLPPLLFMNAEREIDPLRESCTELIKLLKKRGFSKMTEYTCPEHNHVSVTLCLCSGEGEEWGYETVQFIKSY
jgi:hypothetical protein